MARWALLASAVLAVSGCLGGESERFAELSADVTCDPAVAAARPTGDGLVTVPAVSRAGYAEGIEEAYRTLRDAGLLVATTPGEPAGSAAGLTFAYAASLPEVVDQRPPGGMRVAADSVVRLVVVPGPVGLLPPQPPESIVPELTGVTLREALRRIDAAGLYWRTSLPFLPPTDAPGFLDAYCVTSQNPTVWNLGSSVELEVAPTG